MGNQSIQSVSLSAESFVRLKAIGLTCYTESDGKLMVFSLSPSTIVLRYQKLQGAQ